MSCIRAPWMPPTWNSPTFFSMYYTVPTPFVSLLWERVYPFTHWMRFVFFIICIACFLFFPGWWLACTHIFNYCYHHLYSARCAISFSVFLYISFSCRPTRLQLFGAERRVISVTGSKRVMYALLADGSVYSWGEGIPALGHGDNQPRYHYYGVVGRKHVIYTLVSLAVASIQALVHGDFNQGVCTCDGKLYVCVWCLILRATSVWCMLY